MAKQTIKTRKRRATASRHSRAARTNYPAHKRVLLHPATLFGLLCAGVLITGWTLQVVAATTISSVIEAPPLQSAATITTPVSSAQLAALPTMVAGTCPPGSYVNLYSNKIFMGSAWCTDSAFSIQTSLFAGDNSLAIQDFNSTNQAGPTSPSVLVTYQAPDAPGAPEASSPAGQAASAAPASTAPTTPVPQPDTITTAGPPLLVTSSYHFKTFEAEKTFSWQVDLEGGTPPYQVHISWGDGQSSNLTFKTDPLITIRHTFKKSGYFAVAVTSTDSRGKRQVMQLAALITNPSGQAGFLGTDASGGGHAGLASGLAASHAKWLRLAWPAYLVVLLMAASFWLGEERDMRPSHAHVRSRRQ